MRLGRRGHQRSWVSRGRIVLIASLASKPRGLLCTTATKTFHCKVIKAVPLRAGYYSACFSSGKSPCRFSVVTELSVEELLLLVHVETTYALGDSAERPLVLNSETSPTRGDPTPTVVRGHQKSSIT